MTAARAPPEGARRAGISRLALTPGRAAAALAGAVAVQVLPELPPVFVAIGLGLAGILLPALARRAQVIGWLLVAVAWTLWHAHGALDARLPHALEGQDIELVGQVTGLPDPRNGQTRFTFDIDSATQAGHALALAGTARLSWYEDAPALQPCQRWRLLARLRRPRGMLDPGTFDTERQAVQEGIVAVGYVREDPANRALGAPTALCIDRARLAIASAIGATLGPGPVPSILAALAVGDQRAIDTPTRHVVRATGIGHLIAISGLHIGLFAAFGALLARGVWKLFPRLVLRVPGPLLEAPAALACATAYSALAGFGLPTDRTLIMIAAALLGRLARRGTSVPQSLALAAVVLLAWDPLAVLSAGFWLSFAGVAALLLVLAAADGGEARWRKLGRELTRAQLVLSIALLPLTVWFFGQSSVVGPVANLVAVPWVSFVVTPVTVAASLLLPVFPAIGGALLHVAAWLMAPLWSFLAWLAALPVSLWYFVTPPWWAFALALVGAVWCLMPRGVPARSLGVVLLLPLLFVDRPRIGDGGFVATVLDVGQGLSVLVRTSHHALLYDTGARYPGGFDVGESVVVPALHALGVDRLDRLIVSHGDNDHAGGAPAVVANLAPGKIEAGELARTPVPATQCIAGQSWRVDGVAFRMVSPALPLPGDDNDRSCVLLVTGRDGSLLLPGDASSAMEPTIAAAVGPVTRPLALVVPHHGSRTSSSEAFLTALRPDVALVSAGYRNRFGHPAAEVVARYDTLGIPLAGTAHGGALTWSATARHPPLRRERIDRRAWWRER